MPFRKSNAAANAEANAFAATLNTGYLRIYTGSQPATVDTALSGNTLLCELRYNATAFAAAAAGVLTANAIASANPVASGTATFYRAFSSDGTTAIYDDSVAISGAGLIFATDTNIAVGTAVTITALTVTLQKG
jgi:hypothetical protein